jgi:hypothetical protein
MTGTALRLTRCGRARGRNAGLDPGEKCGSNLIALRVIEEHVQSARHEPQRFIRRSDRIDETTTRIGAGRFVGVAVKDEYRRADARVERPVGMSERRA